METFFHIIMVTIPLNSNDQIPVENELEQGPSRMPFSRYSLLLSSSFSLSGCWFQKFPSFYFKCYRKSDFDSSCLDECDPGRGMRRRAKALALPARRAAKWLTSRIFLKFHRCEAASANENFRGFLKSKVKGAKSGT